MRLRDVVTTLLSIAALLAFLAGGTSDARSRQTRHACDAPAMSMEDCHGHHADGSATDCSAMACALGQISLPAHEASCRIVVAAQSSSFAPRNGAPLDELRGPPDLRPPIA